MKINSKKFRMLLNIRVLLVMAIIIVSSTSSYAQYCVGQTITVSLPRNVGCGSGLGSNAMWDGASGGTISDPGGTASDFTVTFTSTGTFRLMRTFSGCAVSVVTSGWYTISTKPVGPVAGELSQTAACSQVTLTASGSSAGAYWQTAPLNEDQTYQTTKVVTATGTYYARMKGGGACWSDAVAVTVSTIPTPTTSSMIGGKTKLYTLNETLSTMGVDGTIQGYRYVENGSTTVDIPSTSSTISVSITNTGSSIISREYRAKINKGGCVSYSQPTTVVVNPLGTPTRTACVGTQTSHSLNSGPCGAGTGTIQIIGSGSGGTPSSNAADFNVTWSTPGIYTIIRNFEGTGCSTTYMTGETVQVYALPAAPLANQVSQTNSCGQVTLSSSLSNVYWQNTAQEMTTTYPSPRTVTTAADYHAKVKDANGCFSPARTVTVSTIPGVPVGGQLAGAGTYDGFANRDLNLTNYTGTIKEYWYKENGGTAVKVTSTTTPLPVLFSNTGAVNLVREYWAVVQLNGCEALSSVALLTVKPLPVSEFPVVTYECLSATTVKLTSNVASDQWFNAPTGGTLVSATNVLNNVAVTAQTLYIERTLPGNVKFRTRYDVDATFAERCKDHLNYVKTFKTQTALTALTESETAAAVKKDIQYFDGIGRLVQTTSINGSPLSFDIVTPTVYDNNGREYRKYLPFVATDGTGSFKTITYAANGTYANNFYNTPTNNIIDDTQPFSETNYEYSPLNRTLKEYGPGSNWSAADQNRPITFKYLLNNYTSSLANLTLHERVIAWKISATGLPTRAGVKTNVIATNGYYESKQLTIKSTKDEDGHETREYTDQGGRVILKKVQAIDNAHMDSVNHWAQTYYLYDDFGLLRYVFQPELTKHILLQTGSYSPSTTDLNRFAFQYKYDSLRRMIEKVVPGADVQYMVYDKLDRLVLTQDGNQRQGKNEWTFTKYDNLNRPVLTGIVDMGSKTVATIRNDAKTAMLSEARGTIVHGYTNNAYPSVADETKYLTVTYYDTYDQGWTGFSYVDENLQMIVNGITYDQRDNARATAKGFQTASKVKVLNGTTNTWLRSVTWYDEHYRVIQTIADNVLTGKDRVTSLLDFDGTLLKESASFNGYPVVKRFEYDHVGRLLKTYHQVNGTTEVLLSSNTYNELGQLVRKELHSKNSEPFKQQIDYRYNIRGWLERINDSQLSTADGGPKDYFGMELGYNKATTGIQPNGLFSGNISAMKWSTNLGLGGTAQAPNVGSPKAMAYKFTYDALNRLKDATAFSSENFSTWDDGKFHERVLKYDLNGNIGRLQRGAKSASLIDDLYYWYGAAGANTNRLLYVRDLVATGSDRIQGFVDGQTGSATDYDYDNNGNLKHDLNKGIGTTLADASNLITYNFLNLPQTVTKGGNTVKYTYDATGRKLSQETVFGTVTKRTDYVGEVVYENGVAQFVSHPEGRVVLASNKLLYMHDGKNPGGMDVVGATLTPVEIDKETFIKVTSNGTVKAGAFPIGGTLAIGAGSYKIRVKGYTQAAGSAAYVRVQVDGVDLNWPGAKLATGPVTEAWTEQVVTVAANAQLKVGVAWNTSTSGETLHINAFEIIQVGTLTTRDYQYNLKDHLGNVRVTFSTTDELDESTATFESNKVAEESSKFVYYDEAVRINAPLFDHTAQSGSDAGIYFYRGINLNGPATTIDGNPWVASATAQNFTWTGYGTFENQNIPLIPATDANRTSMLRASIWGDVNMTVSSVPNGTYDIYLYVWEDSYTQDYVVNVEGVQRLSNYNSGTPGTWTKLGPFRTSITDGNITLFASGVCNLSGLELWTVSQAAGNQAPVVASYLLDKSVVTGQTLTYQFPLHSFMDPNAGTTLTYTATLASGAALPSWLTFNAATRTFTGSPAAANAGFYDVKVTANDGAGGTVSDVFMITVTQPGTTAFYRGININGPALTIDGNSWQAGLSNPNLTFANQAGVFENQSVTLIPATDANRATMIRSSVWGNVPSVTVSGIANGMYDIYLYLWEDNGAQDYSISVEGAVVINNYNSGVGGTWSKLGPFRVIIGDGNLNFSAAGGHACFSGVELRSVTTTNVAVTGLTISPASLDVLVGKQAQVSRTIAPATATSRSVTWSSNNNAIAIVNNDGWVTGVAPGVAIITASINGFSQQATVTVKNTPSSYSTRLRGTTTNEKYGVAKSLSVMPGDIITTEVFVKYLDPVSTNWNAVATNLISTIATGGAPVNTLVDGGAAGSIGSSVFPFPGLVSRTTDPGTGPKAYLNYIVFDRNYNFKTAGFKRVTTAARETGTDVPHERLAFEGTDKIVIAEPGYVYIYLSNENDTPVDVFFDDFKVTHQKGNIIATNEYYPFGLTFNSYQRESSVENRFKFQGQEHVDDLNLGWESFEWRNHQPEIGRFFNVDPLAEEFYYNSSYAFSENKVTSHIELEGLEAWDIKNEWSEEYTKKYSAFVGQRAREIQDSGVECTCEDFAVNVLIDFASENNLPVTFENGTGTYDASNVAYTDIEAFKSDVLKTTGAADLAKTTTEVSKTDVAPGDLFLHKNDKGRINHTQVVTGTTNDVITIKQGNFKEAPELLWNRSSDPKSKFYIGTEIQNGTYLRLNGDYIRGNSRTEGLLNSDRIQARKWNFQLFNFRNKLHQVSSGK
ncbi:DUF6443 domain-containing protein [Chryseolinea sp. T2]|uniref:DUF6443 domain-containing protein n=1 Tax=Chryseolinea sp. T2 TaxID=3129255 RepID=UPI0030787098